MGDTPKAKNKENEDTSCIVKREYLDFASNTTAHGFQWTLRPGIGCEMKIFRCVWFVVSIALVILAVVLSANFVKNEIENPTVSTELKVMGGLTNGETGINGPDFIVCDPNPFNPLMAKEQNISPKLLSYIANLLYEPSEMTTLENLNETTKELQKEYEEVLSNKFNNNTIDMLDSVTTCYSTVDKLDQRVHNGGKREGFLLYIVATRFTNYFDKDIVGMDAYSWDGFAIGVANKGIGTLASVREGLKYMDKYTKNTLAVTKEVIKKEDLKHGLKPFNCNTPDEDLELVFSNDFGYSQKRCRNAYEQLAINEAFRCNIIEIPKANEDLPWCSPIQAAEIHENLARLGPVLANKSECHVDCSSQIYSTELTSAQMSDELRQYIINDKSKEMNETWSGATNLFNISYGMIVVNVHWRSVDYTEIVYSCKNLNDILSAVGGNFGFYFGGSIVTFAEILIFMVILMAQLMKLIYRNIFESDDDF